MEDLSVSISPEAVKSFCSEEKYTAPIKVEVGDDEDLNEYSGDYEYSGEAEDYVDPTTTFEVCFCEQLLMWNKYII